MNKWRFSPGLLFLFDCLMCLCLLVFSNPALAEPAFGPIRGDTLLGKPLQLTTTLFGLTDDQLTQLKPGCMDARVSPTGHSDLAQVSKTQTLVLDFQVTQRGGGALTMRSLRPVNDPVMKISLSSYCPTALFNRTWTVLFNPVTPTTDTGRPASSVRGQSGTAIQFDLNNSAMLKASRIQPHVAKLQASAPVADSSGQVVNDPDPALQFDSFDSPPASPLPPSAKSPDQPANDPQVAAVQNRDNHLIESSARTPVSTVIDTPVSGDSFPDVWFLLAFGSIAMVIAAVAVWLRQRKRSRLRAGQTGVQSQAPVNDYLTTTSDLAFEDDMEQDEDSPEQSSSQLFQSFIGVPTENQAVEFDFTDERPRYDGMIDSNEPCELALAIVNRDEQQPWALPTTYESLVNHRNTSIEKRRQTDSMMLRASLALVEYCYQSTIQMQEIQAHGVKRIVAELRLGDDALIPGEEEAVPDMLNNYVNEKMCRLDSAEQREHMIAQLVALGDHCADYPLCFHSSAWGEFLFQAGREAMLN